MCRLLCRCEALENKKHLSICLVHNFIMNLTGEVYRQNYLAACHVFFLTYFGLSSNASLSYCIKREFTESKLTNLNSQA